MDEEWLSTAAAASLARVHRRTVERWIADGRLPARVEWHGRQRAFRIRRSDLVRFVRSWVREEWR